MLQQAGIPAKPLKLGGIYLSKPSWTADTLANWPLAALRHAQLRRTFDPDWFVHMAPLTALMLPGQLVKSKSALFVVEMLQPTRGSRLRYALVSRKVDRFLCVSSAVRDRLIALGIGVGPERTQIVPPIVTAGEPRSLPEPTPPADGTLRIGIVGFVA